MNDHYESPQCGVIDVLIKKIIEAENFDKFSVTPKPKIEKIMSKILLYFSMMF
jgi:hypothetical protein